MPDAPSSPHPEASACLERKDGSIIPLTGSVSFGRSPNNTVVVLAEGASRNHATIHCGNQGEYWLVDLNSHNGTWVNEQRIFQPTRLQDADVISICGHEFRFICLVAGNPLDRPMEATLPVRQTAERMHWLLIADIRDFTGISQRLPGAELSEFVGRWISECKPVVEKGGARLIKYLGDGFFAAMPDAPGTETRIAEIVRGLAGLSARKDPAFRIVVHLGMVAVGAAPLLNEENFIGSAVNFVFRMEKLADSVASGILVSEAVGERLKDALNLIKLAPQTLKGFDAEHRFFSALALD